MVPGRLEWYEAVRRRKRRLSLTHFPSSSSPMAKKRKAASALEALDRAEDLLESDDYSGAAAAAKVALGDLDLSELSRAATLRGIALLVPLQKRLDSAREPTDHEFREPWELFKKAVALDPTNEEAKERFESLNKFLISEYEEEDGPPSDSGAAPNHAEPLDVIVVRAGASGVGVALMLTQTFGLAPERVLLVERGEGVGETFRRWPKEMRFISPSFNNQVRVYGVNA